MRGLSVSPSLSICLFLYASAQEAPVPASSTAPPVTPDFSKLEPVELFDSSGLMGFRYFIEGGTLYGELALEVGETDDAYVAIGLGKGISMAGKDVVFAQLWRGECSVKDYLNSYYSFPLYDGEAHDDVTLISCGLEDGVFLSRFSRPLSSGDPRDFVVELGERTALVWAFSTTRPMIYHSRNRGGVWWTPEELSDLLL